MVLGQVYEKVIQTVIKDEFRELKEIVAELAEAQKATEKKISELVEAQKGIQIRVDRLSAALEELAEAQKATEKSLNRLTEDYRQTRERLESMSDAVGYGLENQSYKALPVLLKRDLDLQIEGRLLRRYLPGDKKGRYFQVNIYSWGHKNGEKTLVVGEVKTSISRREITRFQKIVEKVAWIEKVSLNNVCRLIVAHDITPPVEKYLRDQGIQFYWSYEL